MNLIRHSVFLLFVAASFPNYLAAQKIDYPKTFLQLLDKTGVELFVPVDAGYKDFFLSQNGLQTCHFTLRSKKENLEIRYLLLPFDKRDFASMNPHIQTMRMVATIATNDPESFISAIQPGRQDMKRDFNADWGRIYFFKPKQGFSNKPHCRLLALYKEGKGTVFVFFLFDKPDNPALDTRYFALRFMDDKL